MNANKALWEKGDFTRLASTMRESGDEVIAGLDVKTGMDVLDLGCGDGTTALPSAQRGANVLGVDIASNLVAAGRERAKAWFADPELAAISALRNGTLQGAYLMLAARALGLDCGPMSGFDHAGVDAEFFAGTSLVSNFVCNLGYADHSGVFARLPRLSFEDACRIE